MPIAYISIGSNMGDALANCRAGIEALERLVQTTVVDQAPFYRTAPVDFTEQEWFVNTLAKISTGLPPELLLKGLKAIESAVGRKPTTVRFGPRLLDMDIVLYEDRVLDQSGLVIPHPRMHERRFVLKPFCDIDPEIVHPVLGQTVAALLQKLDDDEQPVERIP